MTAPTTESASGERSAKLATVLRGGMRNIIFRFVGPLLLFALVLVAIHWGAEQFGVELSGQQIVRSFWILMLAAGVAMTLRRRG